MKRLLTWIIAAPLAVAAVIFSIANRAMVTVDLWPLSWQIDLPLFILVLAGVGLGVVLGGLAALASGARARLVANEKTYEAETLKRERAALIARVEQLEKELETARVVPESDQISGSAAKLPTLIESSDAA